MLPVVDVCRMSPESHLRGLEHRRIHLALAGRREDAVLELGRHLQATEVEAFRAYASPVRAWLERRGEELVRSSSALSSLKIMEDPKPLFQIGWMLCDVGQKQHGLAHVRRAVERSYAAATTLETARSFDAMRDDPEFQALVARARADRDLGLADFREHGGERLLGR
jgi:hypothetical protein